MNLHDRDITRAAKKEGRTEKAIEDAIMLVHDYNATPEIAAQKMNAPLELVLEKLKNQPSVNP